VLALQVVRPVGASVQLGKLWVGVQPLLGLEGDPMRLLFERDLTPHPQYAAAYKWLQQVGWVGVCENNLCTWLGICQCLNCV
jgi:hypothetical protein